MVHPTRAVVATVPQVAHMPVSSTIHPQPIRAREHLRSRVRGICPMSPRPLPFSAPVVIGVHDDDEEAARSSLLDRVHRRRATRRPVQPGIVAVVGAGGRVGCSLLAIAIARECARDAEAPVLLVDGDRFGGGVDVLLGHEQAPGARWPDVAMAGAGVPFADVCAALPATRVSYGLLSMDRRDAVVDTEFAGRFFDDAQGQATMIVDVSRDWSSPIASAALQRAEVVIVAMTTHVRSCASALRLLQQAALSEVSARNCLAAVREVSHGASITSIKRGLPVPVAARIPHIRRLTRLGESGVPGAVIPRALALAAQSVLAHAGV